MSSESVAPIVVVDAAPSNVIAALAAVQSELGGVPKLTAQQRKAAGMHSSDSERGVSYAYRGIDQIAAKVQPLLGRYGVTIVPTRVTSEWRDVAVGSQGAIWCEERSRVTWTIYGPGGINDCVVAESWGVGRDNSDKYGNKASTMAFKNLLLRILCIGDPADDPDHERGETSTGEPRITPAQQEAIRAVVGEIPTEEQRVAVRREVVERWGRTDQILARDGDDVSRFVSSKLREALAAVEPGEPEPDPSAPRKVPAPRKSAGEKAAEARKAKQASVEPGPVEPLAETLTEALDAGNDPPAT